MKPIAKTLKEQISLINVNKPVQVYRNLQRKMWSVKQGTVKFHTELIYLVKCEFIVNERGRQKVLAKKQKSVHAYVKGYIWEDLRDIFIISGELDMKDWRIARYNPYLYESFVSDGNPIYNADMVAMIIQPDMCGVLYGNKS